MKMRLRIGVKNQFEEYSSLFSLWTSQSDVYLSGRSLGGIVKASLHESGQWQISFTSELISKMNIPDQKRHLSKWSRTDNISPGLSLAFRVIILQNELRSSIGHDLIKFIWISNEIPSGFTEFKVILANPCIRLIGWPDNSMGTKLMTNIVLPNSDTLWVVYNTYVLTEEQITNTEKNRNLSIQSIPKSIKDLTNIHSLIIGDESDNLKTLTDISLW